MPGPRPIPTHLKLLRGNPGHQKLNKNEPQPARTPEPPECPSFLGSYALDEWCRIAPELHALGLLTALDVMPLSAYCVACQHWREAEEALARVAERDPTTRGLLIRTVDGNPRINPLLRVAAAAPLTWSDTLPSSGSRRLRDRVSAPASHTSWHPRSLTV